ncbi:G-PROTEIN-RECEP-F1-2 domain-containing protein [Aphelenchoides besseyi]|nr:G-PROTEIN-RECEP-F1-2 domain-containing protein [Aphelenchoides besseyi]
MIVINAPRPKLSATTRKSTFDFPVERKPTLSLDHGYSIDRDTISSSIMEQQRPHMIVEMDRQSYQSATSTPTLYPYAPAVMQKAVVDQVWYPAVLASMVAAKRGTKKTSERLLLYPMLNFSRFNLRTELRVARTIGVVVGCFTLCWLPFTIIYVLQAFDVVVPSAMFTIAFWLGYANSAVNPLIYCACSREFRSTIRKVLIDRNNSYSRSF